MKIVSSLVRSVLSSLDSYAVAESIWKTASRFDEFNIHAKRPSLRKFLESCKLFCPDPIDGWVLPDALWTAICRKQPSLGHYPMGEIAERAFKKTIVVLTVQIPSHGWTSPNQSEREVYGGFCRSLKQLGVEGLLTLFVSHYFFEMSIDQLRRSRGRFQPDFNLWYNFTRKGRFASPAAERKLRQAMANECEEMAALFMPFLKECITRKDPARIVVGLARVAGGPIPKRVPKAEKRQDRGKPFVNVIVGRKSLTELKKSYEVDEKATRLLLHTGHPNVAFSFDSLERALGHSVHSLTKDLLDIGVTVYMSDLYAKRERYFLGRKIGIIMPVRHPKIWTEVQPELERSVSFLGRDDFSIQFVKHNDRTDRPPRAPTEPNKGCICLLSGGLDSVAGAIWALEKGLKPVFVSHYANPVLSGIQKSLVRRLEEKYDQPLQHIGVFVARSTGERVSYPLHSPPRSIMAQYLRSFLFLSLATAVALELGIGRIYIFENGPVALNPRFSEARVNTRTAHPQFIAHFSTLIKAIFGAKLSIENPFSCLTKGEIVSTLGQLGFQDLLSRTNSCWIWFKVPVVARQRGIGKYSGRHDGECLPCILRRVAVDHAGLWERDTNYLTDIFNGFPNLPRDTIMTLADYLRFCQNVRALSDAELLFRFPDLSAYAEGVHPRELVAMYRRHSEEVIHCFRARSNNMFQEIFTCALTE